MCLGLVSGTTRIGLLAGPGSPNPAASRFGLRVHRSTAGALATRSHLATNPPRLGRRLRHRPALCLDGSHRPNVLPSRRPRPAPLHPAPPPPEPLPGRVTAWETSPINGTGRAESSPNQGSDPKDARNRRHPKPGAANPHPTWDQPQKRPNPESSQPRRGESAPNLGSPPKAPESGVIPTLARRIRTQPGIAAAEVSRGERARRFLEDQVWPRLQIKAPASRVWLNSSPTSRPPHNEAAQRA